jgi:2-polyprenyl-3-methyl-5-hydroxy-6-metoxy-1,4-benzoquinol methylase
MKWQKNSDLVQQGETSKETWIRVADAREEKFEVDLFLGKKTDLLKLKKDIVSDLSSKLKYYRESREKLYSGETDYVKECPITGFPTSEAVSVANIYGAEYVQTKDTGHVYVKNRPTNKSINDFYLNDVTYAATYTDKSSAESRLNSIAVPWRDWMISVYEKQYGKKPKRILDVGSGAGHFVEACRRAGMEANGVELSQSSRDFAKNIWGFELDGRDFTLLADDYAGYDIVTFWGLLEHTPNPAAILNTAHKIVKGSQQGGMVISKVPRWNSLSSAIQRLSPSTIIRHIDPMGHIMLFSDASAAELYYRCGFKPTAAWYYGMDVYETFMQVGNHTSNYTALTETKDIQVGLQQFVDEVKFSDGLTLVGIPR